MGYCVFTLILKDGRELPYVMGNAIDFPNLPEDVTSSMIVDLLPHEGMNELHDERGGYHPYPHTLGADYYWCLYEKI